ncbi:MAG TPA: LemA family protein [Vicinamibacteria bacterium]|nr:LemA family protein [Vicinamibacteria bacterium]
MGKGTLIGVGCLVVLLVAAVVLGGMAIGIRNNLVELSQAVDAQWSQVENVYQRRADLIPNLVNTVKGAAEFERGTLEAVTEARASVGRMQAPSNLPNDPAAFARFEQAQQQLSGALARLLVVVERYPDLKANANFRDLMAQLEGTENRISVERMRYNERAQAYNTARLKFPANLFAGLFGFGEKAYFRAQAGAENAPPVNFDSLRRTPAPGPTAPVVTSPAPAPTR